MITIFMLLVIAIAVLGVLKIENAHQRGVRRRFMIRAAKATARIGARDYYKK